MGADFRLQAAGCRLMSRLLVLCAKQVLCCVAAAVGTRPGSCTGTSPSPKEVLAYMRRRGEQDAEAWAKAAGLLP